MTLNSKRPAGWPGAAERRVLFGDETGLFSSIPRPRLQHLAEQLHCLGPAALCYFLEELSRGRDLIGTLEAYAALKPYAGFIKAYAVTPGPFLIKGACR